MTSDKKGVPFEIIAAKLFIAIFPASLFSRLDPPHKHLIWGSLLVLGTLVAGLIPHRKGIAPTVVLAVLAAVVYALS